MQSVLIIWCFMCKVPLLFGALCAKCPYYLVFYMHYAGEESSSLPPPLELEHSATAKGAALFPLFGRFRRDLALDPSLYVIVFLCHRASFTVLSAQYLLVTMTILVINT